MKKYFLLITLMTICIIVIFSCKKAFDPQPAPVPKTECADETEMKIQEFLNSMNTPLKTGSTHSIADAIWYLEATLNYSYAIYDSDFVYFTKDTSNFSIDLNQNGTVNHNDLLATYADMVDSLEAHYDAIQSQTKHVILCDVINVSNSLDPLDLQMVSFIVYDISPLYYDQFGPTEYWYSGDLEGMCGDSIGHRVGQDATTELTYKLNHPLVANDQDVRIYYDPIVTISDINGEDYDYEPAPRGTRGYWYGSFDPNDWVQCLNPDELNFYLSENGIPYIIAANDTYIDREFCFIEVKWDFWPSNDRYFEHHYYNISYGVRHETQVGISPL
jgi:hypothetical protein